MDNRSMNIYEIEERSIMQCDEMSENIQVYGSADYPTIGGLCDDM